VRDHDHRAVAEHVAQVALDRRLGLGVDARERVVEDQDARPQRQRARERVRWRWPPESITPRSPTSVS
jgi:hypothetical protein